jgi:hypothetical protein
MVAADPEGDFAKYDSALGTAIPEAYSVGDRMKLVEAAWKGELSGSPSPVTGEYVTPAPVVKPVERGLIGGAIDAARSSLGADAQTKVTVERGSPKLVINGGNGNAQPDGAPPAPVAKGAKKTKKSIGSTPTGVANTSFDPPPGYKAAKYNKQGNRVRQKSDGAWENY